MSHWVAAIAVVLGTVAAALGYHRSHRKRHTRISFSIDRNIDDDAGPRRKRRGRRRAAPDDDARNG